MYVLCSEIVKYHIDMYRWEVSYRINYDLVKEKQ